MIQSGLNKLRDNDSASAAASSISRAGSLSGLFQVERAPQMHMSVDRISEKLRVHHSHPMVFVYVCACFSHSIDASVLSNTLAAVPMPPTAENTRGVNELCSTSRNLCS